MDEDDFWKACDQNQILVIDKYLSQGGDVDACDTVSDPNSPLTISTSLLTHTLLCLCLQFNRTGLHRASTHGHTEVVTKLLEAGANIHSKDKVQNHRGSEQGHIPVIVIHVQDHHQSQGLTKQSTNTSSLCLSTFSSVSVLNSSISFY